jgi:hypothetical protein
MITRILDGYKCLFTKVGKIVILLASCLSIAAILVYPLWFFALTYPHAYTVVLFALCILGGAVALVRKIFFTQGVPKNAEENRESLSRALRVFVKVLVVFLGIVGTIYMVLLGARGIAVFLALATLFLYGMLAYGTKKVQKK